jgi:hypothetical protein
MPTLCPARRSAVAAAASLGLALLTAPAVSHAQLTRIITNAAVVPGEPATAKFANFSQISFNNAGQASFLATYNTAGGSGFFSAGSGFSLTTAGTLIKPPTADPSLPGNSIYDVQTLSLDDNGRALFVSRSRPPGFAGTAGRVFSTSISGAPIALFQDVGVAAPTGLGTFNAFNFTQATNDGGATLRADVSGTGGGGGANVAFRRTAAGAIIQVSTTNDGALRTVATDRTTGAIALTTQSTVTSSGAAAPTSLSDMKTIARTSLTAPGTGGATYVGFNGGVGTNGTGDVSFGATTRLLGTDKDGLFRFNASDSSISLLAQVGQQAPGATAGNFFQSIDTPGLSREGTTFFQAQVGQFAGSGLLGLYAANSAAAGNGVSKIIAIGDALFGSTLQSFNWSGQPAVNDQGQIAFGYVLDNGERGIVVTPSRLSNAGSAAPEAASGLLFLSGLLPAVGAGAVRTARRRRLRRLCAQG